MKKTLSFVIAIAGLLAMSACTSTAKIGQDSLVCQSARVAEGEPYNNNEMGAPHCPYQKK